MKAHNDPSNTIYHEGDEAWDKQINSHKNQYGREESICRDPIDEKFVFAMGKGLEFVLDNPKPDRVSTFIKRAFVFILTPNRGSVISL
jgi:hypothetical protein